MKNRIIICVSILFLLGIASYFYFINRTVSIITLDINPSIKIYLDRNEKVKKVVALNEDANDIVSSDLKGKTLSDSLEVITTNLVDKGYVKAGNVAIIMHSTGSISNETVESKIKEIFNEKDMNAEVIVIKEVTSEDEELANKYNITPAKASYINSINEENNDFDIEIIMEKPVNEIMEVKEYGLYCDDEYFLEGGWCYKEIKREPATDGSVCARGYYDYNGVCYRETGFKETDKLYCRENFELKDNECVRTETTAATVTGWTCSSGEVRTKAEVGETDKRAGDANDPVCVDPSSVTRPVSPCNLPAGNSTERMSYGGKCYWHRAPIIPEGCPGKIKVNGACWDDASNVYVCPNSGRQRDKDDYCYTVLKNVKATANGYTCSDDMTLVDNKCAKTEREDARVEIACPSGYTNVDYDRCINYNDVTQKVDGFICKNDNARLDGDMCVYYEIVEAKHI